MTASVKETCIICKDFPNTSKQTLKNYLHRACYMWRSTIKHVFITYNILITYITSKYFY